MRLNSPQPATKTTAVKRAHELEQEQTRSAQLQRDVQNLGASHQELERSLKNAQGAIYRLNETKNVLAKRIDRYEKEQKVHIVALEEALAGQQKAEAANRGLLQAHIALKNALKARSSHPPKARVQLCIHPPTKKRVGA